MPPQIKSDINRSGWETTDMPSVCERCLPDNPFVQMLKEDYAAECRLCSRPHTVFRWKADRTSRQKKTGICLTCARLKNCCQCCLLDLSFGLPITIRDAALKMITPGPQSEINREYYAQNHEREIEEGRGLEEYDKIDDKARDLLRRLANSEPYHKKQRRLAAEEEASGQKLLEGPGPARTSDTKKSAYGSAYTGKPGAGKGKAPVRRAFPSAAALPPQPQDIAPPADRNVVSLFVTGVEDDLPEHEIRTYFQQYGALRSVVCSHRSHCAFINYIDRATAEKAAAACQGRALVKGVPLRVQWGRPKPLDSLDQETRMHNARAGQDLADAADRADKRQQRTIQAAAPSADADLDSLVAVAPPPGEDDVEYAALAGE